jgi:DNA-binding MarR family transcriptional regulator
MQDELQKLGRAVKQLQNRHHRALDARLVEIGISLAQWDALRAITWHPNGSAHDLAELTFQTDQSFGALATRMLDKGLITRTAGRGRALNHALTPYGAIMLAQGTALAEQVLEGSFAPLSAAERAMLQSLLDAVLAPGRGPG